MILKSRTLKTEQRTSSSTRSPSRPKKSSRASSRPEMRKTRSAWKIRSNSLKKMLPSVSRKSMRPKRNLSRRSRTSRPRMRSWSRGLVC